MQLSDFDYDLPQELIAQTPVEPRDASRLLVLHRDTGAIEHRAFRDLPEYLMPGDVLVLNQTRVIPARLPARKIPTGGAAEILLLRPLDDRRWLAIVGGKRVGTGTRLAVASQDGDHLEATVVEELEENERVVEFNTPVQPYLAPVKRRCRPTSPRHWPTRSATRPSSRGRKAPPPPRPPGCTSRRRC